MANRRISELPAINGIDVSDLDLLTLVNVFEVDPTLRNKKITFQEFRNYLDQYYLNLSGDVVLGNLAITGNLDVYSNTNVYNFTSSGLSVLSGVIVENNLTASGVISGTTLTGTTVNTETVNTSNLFSVSGIFTDLISGETITGSAVQATNITGVTGVFTEYLSGQVVTGNTVQATSITGVTGVFTEYLSGETVTGTSVQATNITGVTGVFTSYLSGETVTGNLVEATTGNFGTLSVNQFTIQNNLDISGDLTVSGFGTFISGLNVSGVISGQIIDASSITANSGIFQFLSGLDVTGDTANYTSITGVTGVFTSSISGSSITGDSISASFVTGVSGTFTDIVSGTLLYGDSLDVLSLLSVSGVFTDSLSGSSITGDSISASLVTGVSGVFTDLVSGSLLYGDALDVLSLTSVSGIFTSQVSGAVVTGETFNFTSGNAQQIVSSGLTATGEVFALQIAVASGDRNVKVNVQDDNTFPLILTRLVALDESPYGLVISNDAYSNFIFDGLAFYVKDDGTCVTQANGTDAYFVFEENAVRSLQISGGIISGATFTGTFVDSVTARSVSGTFTEQVSGLLVKGVTAQFTSGIFTEGRITTLDATTGIIQENLSVSGSGYFGSGISVTGTISGQTITGTTVNASSVNGIYVTGSTEVYSPTVTGDTGLFTNVTGTTLHITERIGPNAALICSGIVSGDASGFTIQGPLIILP